MFIGSLGDFRYQLRLSIDRAFYDQPTLQTGIRQFILNGEEVGCHQMMMGVDPPIANGFSVREKGDPPIANGFSD